MKKDVAKIILGLFIATFLIHASNGSQSDISTIDELKQARFVSTLESATNELIEIHGYTGRDVAYVLERFAEQTTMSLIQITHECMQNDDIPSYPDVLNYEIKIHNAISDAMRNNLDIKILPEFRMDIVGNQRQEMRESYFKGVELSLLSARCITRVILVNKGFFRL